MTLLTSARSRLARFEEEKKLFKAQEMKKLEEELDEALTSGSEAIIKSCIENGARVGVSDRKVKAAKATLSRLISAR
eukprot:3752873-Pleurochrysis_carterae.AAC.1